jgi:hypothetical protein
MTSVVTALSTSIDGFIAGAEDSPEQPLGVGADPLFKGLSDVTPRAGTTPRSACRPSARSSSMRRGPGRSSGHSSRSTRRRLR